MRKNQIKKILRKKNKRKLTLYKSKMTTNIELQQLK